MQRINTQLMNSSAPLKIALVGVGGTDGEFLGGLLNIQGALKAHGHPDLQVTALDPDEVSPANLVHQRLSDADLDPVAAQVLIRRINAGAGTDWDAHPRVQPPAGAVYAGQ